jgi:purine-binding chemotaxis protein CheW
MTMVQTQMSNRYLAFQIENDYYGIKIDFIKEVYKSDKILKLPKTSEVLAGIIDLRGYILSVFDLSVLLWDGNNHEKLKKNENIILVATVQGQDVGILVDQIDRLVEITDFTEADLSTINGKKLANSSLITQIGNIDDELKVHIIDPEKAIGGYLTMIKSPETLPSEEEDLDFDFSQYTLPTAESESNIEKLIADDASEKEEK